MRINSVDNTTFQALKLNPKKMPEKLQEMSMEYIISMNRFGDRIKDIKLYDVVFDDCFVPQVKSANPEITRDFFGALKKEEDMLGKWYEYQAGEPGEMIGGFYPDEPRIFGAIYGKEAPAQYEKFTKLSQIEQAGELSRLLELRDIRKIRKQERKKAEQQLRELEQKTKKEQRDNAVNDLMILYAKTEETEPKKKWYQKIFFL